MRTKLSLTIALGCFAAVTALGVGMAGADSPPAPETALPTPTIMTPASQAPACSNGVDDDGDGLVDMNDPDCESPSDNSEGPSSTPTSGPSTTPSTPTPGVAEATAPPAPEVAPAVKRGVTVGATIHAPSTTPQPGHGKKRGGVTHNQSIAAPAGAENEAGGLTFPSATGGGEQPQPEAPNGGAQFASGGSPTASNPTTTIAPFGPAPIGVPNFIISSFEIPPFLLPIYQACGTEYGIPWEVLAAINKIETAFGTNLNVSTAGAVGWMQFIPSTWARYGVDANGDGRKDPYNPVDAICAAANYLKASGGDKNLYNAILSYNHADWYAQEVLLYARSYGRLPSNLVGSLTGLTEGAHFPVAASARYADEISTRAALRKATPKQRSSYANADIVSSSPTRRGIDIFAAAGAPVVAVNDGVIKRIGHSKRLGRYLVLEDAYGNRYTYAELGPFVEHRSTAIMPTGKKRRVPVDSEDLRPRIFAFPNRVGRKRQAVVSTETNGLPRQSSEGTLEVGSRVIAGAVLARISAGENGADPHLNFSIRPAGRGAPRIDPKPILDGWKLLEATAIYRASGRTPFPSNLGVGGVLLLSKEALQRRVLADHHLHVKSCGRYDVSSGHMDRRVLAMLEYLVAKGFDLTANPQSCGQENLAGTGKASGPGSRDAVEIRTIDGVPVRGHQGPGTLTNQLIKAVLELQGTMHPQRVISAENLPGATSFALPNHTDNVEVGYSPAYESSAINSFLGNYVNPFLNATTGRIDQGVDFTGVGPIAAVGDARILQTGAPGWPEGGGVLYQLLDGPRAGQVIYVFEGVQATVHAGERVSAGQQIALFVPGGSIEMGFADAAGVPVSHGEYSEGVETEGGREMARFLAGLGTPSALAPGSSALSPEKWNRLMQRLGQIQNPTVPTGPSKYSLPVTGNESGGSRSGK